MRSIVLAVLAALVLAGCADDSGPKIPQPLSPQPTAAQMDPGLSVQFWKSPFNDVSEVERYTQRYAGIPGKAVTMLDFDWGNGVVLDSALANDVGVEFLGAIRLDKPGRYGFTALSNDGVRVMVGGVTVTEDGEPHPDRWSRPGHIEVAAAGWYPLRVLYYEKRGTAVLRLYWQQPGDAQMSVVPAAVLARKK